MLWMHLTSEEFPRAVRESEGVCVVPLGVLERHGAHLPLGHDQLSVSEIARRAADVETAVVFPDYYFGKIHTCRYAPGVVSLPRDLMFALLERTLDEIGRNGFTRILIASGHGGNPPMLACLLRSLLERRRDYTVYACDAYTLDGEDAEKWETMRETTEDSHAGEMEASVALHLFPELAHMDALTDPADGRRRGDQDHLRPVTTSVDWYGNYPTHYAGDARTASADKGEFLVNALVDKVVRAIRAIKRDDVSPRLLREFHRKAETPSAQSEANCP